jgi:hypothetical protein
MFTRLRERSGSAGLIVAILALVVALGGTAYAAAKLNSVQKKEVVKIAKKYAGKNGVPGAQGAPGTPGVQGPKGDAGTKGENGAPGQDGQDGQDGNPGEAGVCSASKPECVMPPGATLTGVWGASSIGSESGVNELYAPVSFPLRHSGGLNAVNVVQENGTPTTACPGSAENPKALPGNLCIYIGSNGLENANFGGNIRVDDEHSGVILDIEIVDTTVGAFAHGTWALTQ